MKMSEAFELPLKKDDVYGVMSFEKAEAICEAVNAHDTHLSHIHRLLDKLENCANEEGERHERAAHQAVTELREIYPTIRNQEEFSKAAAEAIGQDDDIAVADSPPKKEK